MPDGILLVDKPGGMTSADVVRRVKRHHRPKSIGHLGTLDPMATGLLPLCIDRGTRIAQFLGAESKAYRGRIRLGVATKTLDRTGEVTEEQPVPAACPERLVEAAASFVGEGEQVPPMVSAVKHQGRRLYELAREGVEVARPPRKIFIESFAVSYADDEGVIDFEVRCSKGTYIRVLAAELGAKLGTVACLDSLERTEFGRFCLQEAHGLEDLLGRDSGDLPTLGLREALRGAKELAVDESTAFGLAAGQRHTLEELADTAEPGGFGRVIAPNGGLLAVVQEEAGAWKLRRVVMPEATDLYRPRGGC